MINRYLAVFILFLAGLFNVAYSQNFKKLHDQVLDKLVISYYNIEAGVAIQKLIDSNKNSKEDPIYEIGLIVYDKTIASDDFMKPNAIIVFDDQSYLEFKEEPKVNYLYSGKHSVFVKHKLTEEELEILQHKKMKFFRIYHLAKTFDKWQPEKLKEAFEKIQSEQID